MTYISRIHKLQFDIQGLIDYEFFSTSEAFSSVIDKIDKAFEELVNPGVFYDIFDARLLIDYTPRLGVDTISYPTSLIHQFIMYDIEEHFVNLSETKLEEIKEYFQNVEYDFYEFDILDMLQFHFIEKEGKEIKTTLPYYSQEDYLSEGFNETNIPEDLNELVSGVIYSLNKKRNKYNIYYIIYSIMMHRESIYMIFKNTKELIICNEYNLTNNISHSALVYNLSEYFKNHFYKQTYGDIFKSFENDYENEHKSLGAFFKIIANIYEKMSGDAEFIAKFKESDMNKINEVDQLIVDGDVTFAKRKGIKAHIKAQVNYIAKKGNKIKDDYIKKALKKRRKGL